MELPSKILEQAVDALATLPGVGKRSALRYALHLMKSDEGEVADFLSAIGRLKTDLHHCQRCHCVSDTPICPICSSPKRMQNIICVVENIQDVMALENTQQYRGLYHVLGGVISPIDGIGINDLNIGSLLERVRQEQPTEVILALPTTMEGDTTNFYINKQLQQFPGLTVSTIARGISIGDNLEYADEVTLGRSIANRIPFNTIKN
ncbi:MAG: recombination mediator RecR [Bacteroidales bacterium]|nr:recombination mediator RecR [Bacteroidales bacterium]